MVNTDQKELRKKVFHSLGDLLVLQSLKEEPLPKNKILPKISSKLGVWLPSRSVYSVLSSLKEEGLVLNNPKKTILTKKGEHLRQKLVGEHLNLQRTIERHLR